MRRANSSTEQHQRRSSPEYWAGQVLRWRYLLVVGLGLLMALFFLQGEYAVAGGPGFPLDDSWIHARFAQNLVRGQGFSFNPGIPSAGSTAPLWTLLFAGAHTLSGEFVGAAKVLGTTLFLLSLLLLGRLAEELSAGNRAAGLLAGLAAALCGPLVISALGGMETALYGCLALAGIYAQVRWRDDPGWRSYLPTVAFALATMARPECGLLFIFGLLDRVTPRLRARRGFGPLARELALHGLIFAGLMLPYAIFYLAVSGQPYPHTLTVKTQVWNTPDRWQSALSSLYLQFEDLPKLGLGLVLLLPVGLLALSRRPRTGILFLVLFLYAPLRQALVPVFYPAFQFHRYYMHVVEVQVLVSAVGLIALPDIVGLLRGAAAAASRWRGPALAALGVLFLLTAVPPLLEERSSYAQAVENITDLQIALGRWLAENTSPGNVIAASDIGAIAVFSDREIIDVVGLVSPELTARQLLAWRLSPTDPRARQTATLDYLIERQPDYLVTYPDIYSYLTERTDLFQPYYYARITQNVVCDSDTLVIYRTPWTRP